MFSDSDEDDNGQNNHQMNQNHQISQNQQMNQNHYQSPQRFQNLQNQEINNNTFQSYDQTSQMEDESKISQSVIKKKRGPKAKNNTTLNSTQQNQKNKRGKKKKNEQNSQVQNQDQDQSNQNQDNNNNNDNNNNDNNNSNNNDGQQKFILDLVKDNEGDGKEKSKEEKIQDEEINGALYQTICEVLGMKIRSKNRGEDDDSDEDSEELSSDSDLDEIQEEEDIKYYFNTNLSQEEYEKLPEDHEMKIFQRIAKLQNHNVFKISDIYKILTSKTHKQIQKHTQRYLGHLRIARNNYNKNKFQGEIYFNRQLQNFREKIQEMNNYIDIPNENELYDVDEYQQKKMAEYKKPEKIKNLEQLKRILQKNGESKKDYFLHIINYGQNLSQFENNIKNIYNQVNQVEFFQNLKKQLKRNIRQVINSQEYFLNGDLKQVKKVKNNLGENSKIFRNQPSLSKTFSYQEDSLGLESGNKLNNYESNANMILSRQNSIQQPDQMLNLHQKQLNFNQNQNEISKQQSLSVNKNLFDEEDDAHGEEQKQQNLIQNQQQQNQKMELEFQKPNKVRNNGMLSKKLQIDQVNFDENQELNQFFQQPKIQEQKKKLDFQDEDQDQLQEEQIQMLEFQDQEWDGINNLRKHKKILNKEMEYKKNGHLFSISSSQDGKNQVERKREMILNQFNYYNQDVFNQSWLLPKRSLNRVEIDLNDKQFFLEKVNGILSVETKIFKEIEKKKQKEIEQQKKEQENLKPTNQMDKISAHELQSSVHGGAMSIAKGSDNQIKKDSEQIIKPAQGLVSVDHLIEQNKQNFKESDIQHSLVALSFKYNEFKQEPKSYKKYHRFCIVQHLLSKSNERFLGITRPIFMKLEHQSKVKNQDLSFDQGVENMESFQKFDTSQKLSCMGGQFALFEYAEQNPLIMQNIGMGSKIYKYVYDYRLKEQIRLNENMNQLSQFRDYINKKLGSLGSVKFLNKGEKCGDLIGNLLDRDIIGLTVLKNNLFQAPIFIKKAPVTDFLLVKRKEKDPVTQQEVEKYYLRKINHIYIVGQIEPMTEVFNPSQRLYTQFNKKLLNTVVQVQIAQNGSVTLQDLQNIFIKEDEAPLKKALQDNAQPAYVDNSYIIEDPAKRKDPKQYEVKPEQACSYEKMLNSKFLLENFGIKKMVKCEKIKIAINQYIENRPEDLEGYVIAKLIWDQLNLAGWNLTSNF